MSWIWLGVFVCSFVVSQLSFSNLSQWLQQTAHAVWEHFEFFSSRDFAVIACSNGGSMFSLQPFPTTSENASASRFHLLCRRSRMGARSNVRPTAL